MGAWVEDESTKVDTALGQILAPASQSFLTGQANFSEYFGAPVASPNLVPRSIVEWSNPSADQISPGHYRYTCTFDHGTKGAGNTGQVVGNLQVHTPDPHLFAVQITQGG